MDNDTFFIKRFCQNPKLKKLKDDEIAKMLIKLKRFERFKSPDKWDSMRRKVSMVRRIYDLRDKADMGNFNNDIEQMIQKYPEAPVPAIATKLHLKYPHLAQTTILYYVKIYKIYGIKAYK